MDLFNWFPVLYIFSIVTAHHDQQTQERFTWFSDGTGKLHLIDLFDDSKPTVKFDPEADIRYLLYTKKNPKVYQEIKKGDIESLMNSNFNGQNPTKFTIHGWNADYNMYSNTDIRDAFFDIDDVNMITVDWSVGASDNYLSSMKHAITGGRSVAGFLDWIHEVTNNSFATMHIIGHSLGGHFSGAVGRYCTRGTVGYITGMDPAYPLWGPNSERIRKTDANYVEIIHTNIGLQGMIDAVGHNDFYPNGGRFMPGCGLDLACSHHKVIKYMAESIRHGGFTSVECSSVNEATSGVNNCKGSERLGMGTGIPKPEIGILALNTNDKPPYSMD